MNFIWLHDINTLLNIIFRFRERFYNPPWDETSNMRKLHLRSPVHDEVIKWKHFPRCWPFVRGIHRSPVNSPHKGHWRGALMFHWNEWVTNREAGDLRRHRAHYDVIVMISDLVHRWRGFHGALRKRGTYEATCKVTWLNLKYLNCSQMLPRTGTE